LKTVIQLPLLLLSMAYCFITIAGIIQSDQNNTISDKSIALLPDDKIRPEQEIRKYQYVGIEKCASECHNNKQMGFQYDIVKSSPHSKAYDILTSKKAVQYSKNVRLAENPQESLVCLRCHVTGGGLDSSYLTLTYKKEDGVTCEACHKGEFITKSFLPKESDCLKCHNDSVHKTRKFNFRNGCAKIAHPRPKVKLN
jgi:hypothetical protein